MNKLIETAKELDRILESGIEILPNSPIHEKLKQALNIAGVMESASDAFDRGFTAGYNAGVKMGLAAD